MQTAWIARQPEHIPDLQSLAVAQINHHRSTYIHTLPCPMSTLYRKHFPLVNLSVPQKSRPQGERSPDTRLLFSVQQRQLSPSESDDLCLVPRLPNFARLLFSCRFVILGNAPLKHHPRQTTESISCGTSQKQTGQNHTFKHFQVSLTRKGTLTRKFFCGLFH